MKGTRIRNPASDTALTKTYPPKQGRHRTNTAADDDDWIGGILTSSGTRIVQSLDGEERVFGKSLYNGSTTYYSM